MRLARSGPLVAALLAFAASLTVVLIALALLLESFGRDVVWLAVHRLPTTSREEADQPTKARTT